MFFVTASTNGRHKGSKWRGRALSGATAPLQIQIRATLLRQFSDPLIGDPKMTLASEEVVLTPGVHKHHQLNINHGESHKTFNI